MTYPWILFDLDNTLYDFDAASHFALLKTFEEQGIEGSQKHQEAYYKINHACWTAFENGTMDFATLRNIRFKRFVEQLGLKADAKTMSDRYLQLLSVADHKIEGAIPLLDYLKPRHHLAVVTNGLKEVKRPQLSKPAIAHYFKAIIISEEIGVAKPHRGFFEQTFERIGQPPKSEVIIVGDNLNSDIRGGNDFGIATCWFNPKQKRNDTAVNATFEIDRLDQLIDLVS